LLRRRGHEWPRRQPVFQQLADTQWLGGTYVAGSVDPADRRCSGKGHRSGRRAHLMKPEHPQHVLASIIVRDVGVLARREKCLPCAKCQTEVVRQRSAGLLWLLIERLRRRYLRPAGRVLVRQRRLPLLMTV
jgi:hypothetical protein